MDGHKNSVSVRYARHVLASNGLVLSVARTASCSFVKKLDFPRTSADGARSDGKQSLRFTVPCRIVFLDSQPVKTGANFRQQANIRVRMFHRLVFYDDRLEG